MDDTTTTTPKKNTRSLSLSSDPVSRMREIHDLEAPVVIPAEEPQPEESKQEILQARNIASKQEILQALKDGLNAPYPEDYLKQPLTTITTRIPSEIAQRLEWASTITGNKKQEVLAEALRLYFEKIANNEV
jgi:hypothetical protein